MKKTGISLIVLVITIIVIIIISGSVVLSLSKNNPIEQASEATFKTELNNIQEEYQAYFSTNMLNSAGSFNSSTLYANETALEFNTKVGATGNIHTVLPSMDDSLKGKIKIVRGKIVFSSLIESERQWAHDFGMTLEGEEYYGFDAITGTLYSSDMALSLMQENGVLEIPSYVKTISAGAFFNVSGLKTVILPGTVENIGSGVFQNNAALTSVTMGNGLKTIGFSAFENCTGLKNIVLPNSVTSLGHSAFENCTGLESITLPNNITILNSDVLYNCRKLTSLIIPDSITTISSYSLGSCLGLTSITIPINVNRIDSYAFQYDSALTSITIPKNVSYIGDGVFLNCTSLPTIVVDAQNTYYKMQGGILYSTDLKTMVTAFPQAVAADKSLVLPEGVEYIRSYGFTFCTNLVTISLPSTIKSINEALFRGINTLTTINISPSNASYCIDNGSIYSKDMKRLVMYFNTATNAVLPEGVNIITTYAFLTKCNITSLTLPSSLTTIENQGLYGCNLLRNLSLGNNITSLHPLFLYNTAVTNLQISAGNLTYKMSGDFVVSKDGTKLVWYMLNDANVIIPTGITEIYDYAFHNKWSTTSITIPNTVTKINHSFQYCSGLSSIEIPSSVTSIGSSAFSYCNKLTRISINKTRNSIIDSPWGDPYGLRAVDWIVE
jgi:hypothetical protein